MIEYLKKSNTSEDIDKILNPVLKKWFYSRFKEYSLPQKYAVLKIHSRENVLISAPTGATKSLTSFMSVLNELVDSSLKNILEDKIYCIYVSPLKSLNNDINRNLQVPLKEIEEIAKKKLGIRVSVRTGDTTSKEKSEMLKKPPHILITTPESLSIMLTSKKFKEHLNNIEWAIIDEIHSFAENKRGVSLSLSLEFLQKLSPGMSRVGLSATVSPLTEIAKYLVGTRDCKIVDVSFMKEKDIKLLSPVNDFLASDFKEIDNKLYKLLDQLIQKHKTTLIFTNTRSATERIVHHLIEKFPKNYSILEDGKRIGAHHSSLSRDHRLEIEEGLRNGKLKVVVSSTSLELGIDIGYIDLVILLGSPKSVARSLQRIGRAGHKLHSITKGRIIVLDRDDLVECSILMKNSLENKIDEIYIPKNSLDVLAQHIIAATLIFGELNIKELYELIKNSYCYFDLKYSDYYNIIYYLSGMHTELEKRKFYAKIYFNEEKRTIRSRGKLARVLYMTNAGTIPDTSGVLVKIKDQVLGVVEESFAEHLRPRDIFVLGGNTYLFRFSRGQTIQVSSASGLKPTVPSWFSQMLPLSFDLAIDIGKFRALIETELNNSKNKTLEIISKYSHVDISIADTIYKYFKVQNDYIGIPTNKKLIIEEYISDDEDQKKHYFIFHALFGRRVNDCLSRAMAYILGKKYHSDIEIGINDNGFYLSSSKTISFNELIHLFILLSEENIKELMNTAIETTEILARRFRHCAVRSFLILRNYLGKTKRVGRQQLSSKILFHTIKQIDPDFVIIKEAKREVLEDVMDIKNAELVLKNISNKKILIKTVTTKIPSPFATNLILQGYSDILKASDKLEFFKKMHQMVLAKIALDKTKNKENLDFYNSENFNYNQFWKTSELMEEFNEIKVKNKIFREFRDIAQKNNYDGLIKSDFNKLLQFEYKKIRKSSYKIFESLTKEEINSELKSFLEKSLIEIKRYNEDIL